MVLLQTPPDIYDILDAVFASYGILIAAMIFAIIAEIFCGAIFLKFGIEAGDGKSGSTFNERLGTTLLSIILSMVLPPFGTLWAIKQMGERHDMEFGKSVLCYIVWSFLNSLVVGVVMFIVMMIGIGASLIPLFF